LLELIKAVRAAVVKPETTKNPQDPGMRDKVSTDDRIRLVEEGRREQRKFARLVPGGAEKGRMAEGATYPLATFLDTSAILWAGFPRNLRAG
jgi:hypothetical protein